MRTKTKICFFLLCILYLVLYFRFLREDKVRIVKDVPVILWWTGMFSDYDRTVECGYGLCRFTVDRSVLYMDMTKAIVFYGSNINISDLPIPRLPNHIWALLHEESPKNLKIMYSDKILKHFNITSTFSRYSNMPLTIQYLDSYELLRTQKYLIPIAEKTKLRKTSNLAPIAFVQSICDTMTGRNEYVEELMKYIKIDSYGQCLHNRDMPESLTNDYLQTISSEKLYNFLARYKFIISYENGVCNDYITEKFWRPIIIGSIPIYFGSPTIKDWLPNANSAILIEDFDSPQELANFIKSLDEDDVAYNKYLKHKYSQDYPVSNLLLKKALENKEYETNNDIPNSFECFVCKKVHSTFKNIATPSHYDCNTTPKYPKMNSTFKDFAFWKNMIRIGKCEGDLLDEFLIQNKNFSNEQFRSEFDNKYNTGKSGSYQWNHGGNNIV